MGAFTDSVDPTAFTIQNPPDYIFLCGGPLKNFDHSLRAHFYEYKVQTHPILSTKVLLAEKADDWYQSRKLFDDLLELEEYLAGLSACVLVFVESPGAIAEFGAFSQIDVLQAKLVVVIEDTYFKQQSFIRHGLVEHASRIRPESVLTYPWLSFVPGGPSKIDPPSATDTLDGVEREIENILANRPKTATFRNDDHGHRMLLIADLITLNVIILQTEIHQLLADLKVTIKPQELKKYLFLLEQLGLIVAFRYGNVEYYIGKPGAPEYVSYATKKPTDRARLRILLRNDFSQTPEKSRALAAFKRKPGGVL